MHFSEPSVLPTSLPLESKMKVEKAVAGYQFAHMENYSAQGAPGAGSNGQAKKKNGQRAWTAQQILDEAERRELASLHVDKGGPPPQILPGAVSSFADLRDAQTVAATIKESFPYTRKDGTVTQRRRKLRADAASLYTSVMSLPVLTEDALADPVLKASSMQIIGDAMQHESKRLAGLGGKMMMGVIHWDEKHVHVHFYGLDQTKGRVDHLHPGRTAKAAFHAANKSAKGADVMKAANAAYCDAMRKWQNDLHRDVFSHAGLLRYGPGRARLSTADYNKLKAAKVQEAKDRALADAAKARRKTHESALAAIVRQAGSALQENAKASNDVARRKIDLLVRENEVSGNAVRAEQEIERGREMAHTARAQKKAIEVGMDAIETRQIDYHPPQRKKPESLKFGPNAPQDEAKRTTLIETIRPAYDFLVRVAKRALGLRQKEEEQKQRDLELDEARRAEEAEMRRRASVIAQAERKAGREASKGVMAIIDDKPSTLSHDDFPGAWAIEHNADAKKLHETFDRTSNVDMRVAYLATCDAVLICQEEPEAAGDFIRGRKAIEAVAGLRGFDLETGIHDATKAKDPALAARHCDQLPKPIKVVRKDDQRQRLRGH